MPPTAQAVLFGSSGLMQERGGLLKEGGLSLGGEWGGTPSTACLPPPLAGACRHRGDYLAAIVQFTKVCLACSIAIHAFLRFLCAASGFAAMELKNERFLLLFKSPPRLPLHTAPGFGDWFHWPECMARIPVRAAEGLKVAAPAFGTGAGTGARAGAGAHAVLQPLRVLLPHRGLRSGGQRCGAGHPHEARLAEGAPPPRSKNNPLYQGTTGPLYDGPGEVWGLVVF